MVAKTPAQRQHEYKVRNSKAVKLSKLRFVVKTSNKIKTTTITTTTTTTNNTSAASRPS